MHFTWFWVKHRESLYILWRKHLQCTYKFYQEEYCIAYKISLNHFPTWNLWRENSNSNGSPIYLEKRWKVLFGQIITLCFLIGVCELKVGAAAASRSFAKASQYGFGETAKVLLTKSSGGTVCRPVAEVDHILMHCRIILQWTVLKIPLQK